MAITSVESKMKLDNIKFSIKEFRKYVECNSVVLVNIGADYCMPCHDVRVELNIVKQSMEEDVNYGGKVKIVSIDADECSELAKELEITRVPTQFLYKNGVLIAKRVGSATHRYLTDFVKKGFEDSSIILLGG